MHRLTQIFSSWLAAEKRREKIGEISTRGGRIKLENSIIAATFSCQYGKVAPGVNKVKGGLKLWLKFSTTHNIFWQILILFDHIFSSSNKLFRPIFGTIFGQFLVLFLVNFWSYFWPIFGLFKINFRSIFGQFLVHFWSTFGPLLVQLWSTFGPFLIHFWSIFSPFIILFSPYLASF